MNSRKEGNRESRIITFTVNPTVDVNTEVEQIVPDRKLRCSPEKREAGGGGINVSRALSRLGRKSTAVLTSGGETGMLLAGLLEVEKIDHVIVPIGDYTRENLMVRERSSGSLYRLVLPGPRISPEEEESCLSAMAAHVQQGDYLVLSGSLPKGISSDFYAKAVRRVRDRGVYCVLDTSREPLMKGADAGVFLLKPNMRELSQLVGREIGEEEEQLRAAVEVVERGTAEILVVSLGAAGALLVTENVRTRLRAPSVPVVSKVGAGDSMVSGIVFGLTEGYPIDKAVQFGIAAGAAAVMTPGTELCRREDAIRLFERLRGE